MSKMVLVCGNIYTSKPKVLHGVAEVQTETTGEGTGGLCAYMSYDQPSELRAGNKLST